MTALALITAMYFWAQRDWLHFSWTFLDERAPLWFYLLPLIWIFLIVDLYDIRKANNRADTLRGILFAAGFSILIYLFVFFVSPPNSLPRRGVAFFLVGVSLFTLLWRLLYIQVFTGHIFRRRALIVGAGKAGATIRNIIREVPSAPFEIIGWIDDDPEKQNQMIEGLPVLGPGAQLVEIAQKEAITDIIFAITGEMNPAMFQSLMDAGEKGVEITTMPVAYEEILGRVPIFLLQSDWMLRSFIDQTHVDGFFEFTKRFIDLIIGLAGLVVMTALAPLISLGIVLDDGFPIFFSQPRVGKNGVNYSILKFRTMRKDDNTQKKDRTAGYETGRITRFGKILRKSHLDELPQVFNILKGEMSMVGPRSEQPGLVKSFQKEIPFYRTRLFVKPGLTGWAQINYKYADTIEDTAVKLEYDLYYIKKRTLLMDISIILRTIWTVIGLKGR